MPGRHSIRAVPNDVPQIINEKLGPNGFVPLGTTPERFSEIMKEDVVKYAKIAKDARIKPE